MLRPGDEYILDGEGRPQLPMGIQWVLVLALRGYIAWLVALTFSADRSRLLSFFYSNKEQFLLALLVGLPALWVLALNLLLRPSLPAWIGRAWRYATPCLWVGWALDAWLLAQIIALHWPAFSPIKAGLVLAWAWSGWYLLKSRKWRRYQQLLGELQRNGADS